MKYETLKWLLLGNFDRTPPDEIRQHTDSCERDSSESVNYNSRECSVPRADNFRDDDERLREGSGDKECDDEAAHDEYVDVGGEGCEETNEKHHVHRVNQNLKMNTLGKKNPPKMKTFLASD